MFGGLPGIDPLSFPDAAFQGDTLTILLKGRNLDLVEGVSVRPTKGITCQLGDSAGHLIQTVDTLLICVQIDRKTPPGEKYLSVQAPSGTSNTILFIVMM